MKLTSQAIEEFTDLHEEHFGYKPDPIEAEKDLLMLMRLIADTQTIQEEVFKL